jgi:hypothetical protein
MTAPASYRAGSEAPLLADDIKTLLRKWRAALVPGQALPPGNDNAGYCRRCLKGSKRRSGPRRGRDCVLHVGGTRIGDLCAQR